MTRRLAAPLLAVALATGFSTPLRAQQSGGGLSAEVARISETVGDLIDRAGRPAVTVLPFAGADGTCTVFGTYLADEMQMRLQGDANTQRTIIDRSRLTALLAQRGLRMSALLEPATASAMATETGLEAIALGTVTDLGAQLRISVRLISTKTGQLLSATALTIARDNQANTLLGQPVTAGGLCATASTAAPSTAASTTASSAPGSDAGSAPASNVASATAGSGAGSNAGTETGGGDEIARLFTGRWEGFVTCGNARWTVTYDVVARSRYDILADFHAIGRGSDTKLKSRIFFTGRDKPVRFDTQSKRSDVYDYSYKMVSDRSLVGGVDGSRLCESMLNKVGD